VIAPRPRFLPATSASWSSEADVVVVGTGAAGLSAALSLASSGRRVVLLAKSALMSGSTPLAQGGLAVVTDLEDSFSAHAHDTVVAAAGLADEERVNELVHSAPGVVETLIRLGARFDTGSLGLEGGHSHRRIVHAGGDAIGAELHRVLRAAVLASDVEIMEHTAAIDLVTDDDGHVAGLSVGRVGAHGTLDVGCIETRAVVLATGGCGQAFASSTNPADVTGDGLALAARAGAELANVEFVQFHPTVLYVPGTRGQSPLITEALRGAGGVIVDDEGYFIMRGEHPLGDLAPRDVVAYSMVRAMNERSVAHLWLDARSVGARRLESEFPTTVAICRARGIDPTREPIPIAPGAHYACGGVRADLNGRTSIRGLFAVGEVAATGVHGANRLASNSLTEAIVTGRRVAATIGETAHAPRASRREVSVVTGAGVRASSRGSLATSMSQHASVVRDREGLESVLASLELAPSGDAELLDLATLEATNLHTASLLLVSAAMQREESRGCHRRRDFPSVDPARAQPLVLRIANGEIVTSAGAMAGA
jgi:L-aspartate oxidase